MKTLVTNGKYCFLAIAAPSGGGKTTLCRMLLNEYENLNLSISTTTRKIRGNEVDGKDYFFVDTSEFESLIKENKMAEWAKVFGNYYGTSLAFLDSRKSKDEIVLLDIDVQGVEAMKAAYPNEIISCFILPPDMKTLEERLRSRGTDNEETIQMRIETAKQEIAKSSGFDYRITNSDLETAFKELCEIIDTNIGLK